MRRSGEIHFYAPGLKRYRTSEYDGQDPGRFVSISVTGAACALQCDHCRSRVLEGMLPANGKGLFELARDLAGSGARGILVSGGCDRRGRVPLLPHVADLKRIRSELGMTIRVHPGLPDEETAVALGKVGVDGAMLDVIGAEETIREVYHLEVGVEEYDAALGRLARHGVPLVPHIILGLHRGRMLGEWEALAMVSRHRPKLIDQGVDLTLRRGQALVEPDGETGPVPVEHLAERFETVGDVGPSLPTFLGHHIEDIAGTLKRAVDVVEVFFHLPRS